MPATAVLALGLPEAAGAVQHGGEARVGDRHLDVVVAEGARERAGGAPQQGLHLFEPSQVLQHPGQRCAIGGAVRVVVAQGGRSDLDGEARPGGRASRERRLGLRREGDDRLLEDRALRAEPLPSRASSDSKSRTFRPALRAGAGRGRVGTSCSTCHVSCGPCSARCWALRCWLRPPPRRRRR
jgi:hypothetical protein